MKEKIEEWEDKYFKFVKKNESRNGRGIVKKYLEEYWEFVIDFEELEVKVKGYEIGKKMEVIKKIDRVGVKKVDEEYVEDEG
ncbi:hypothetical protein [Staphylococcus epidermidis]|uniref:hypothetical protein n=1 Tax=Staphylococcus epidermidis TaxID=1282 RepID=UPI0011A622DC|nr:hypothetical protein [Staphylococcus epidermidis]